MKPARKERIDQLLVDRGLADSRQKAQALILAGAVLVNGQKAQKPGQTVAAEASLELTEKLKYVGRGGLKLEAALDRFAIGVADRVCVDIGASTGGFTDCLLQRGARRVYAFDAGSGQLDWKLRNDPRVVVHENCNARYLTADLVPELCDLAVFDVSFISVTKILPAVVPLLRPEAELVILVKPQFEAERDEVGKGGIVRDPQVQERAVQKVRAAAAEFGYKTEWMESPILGAEGNREFLLHGRR